MTKLSVKINCWTGGDGVDDWNKVSKKVVFREWTKNPFKNGEFSGNLTSPICFKYRLIDHIGKVFEYPSGNSRKV